MKKGAKHTGLDRVGAGDNSDNDFATPRFGIGDPENQAVVHGRMSTDDMFDGVGRYLPSSDIHDITRATAEVDVAVGQARQVIRLETAVSQSRVRLRPVGLPDGSALNGETSQMVLVDSHTVQRSSHESGVGSRLVGSIVSDASAFAGAVEIMDFECMLVVNGMLERERQGCTGGDGKPDGGLEDAGFVPCLPQCRHRGQCDGVQVTKLLVHRFRQRSGAQDQRDAAEDQGQDQARKAVRMGEGNDPQVRPVKAEPHGDHDIFDIGRELVGGESDEPRGAGTGRGEFEMNAFGRDFGKGRRGLSGVERADDTSSSPCREQGEQKAGVRTLRANDRLRGKGEGGGGLVQFREGPFLRTGEITQRHGAWLGANRFLPEIVQERLHAERL